VVDNIESRPGSDWWDPRPCLSQLLVFYSQQIRRAISNSIKLREMILF
jgi:hypothetical protein